MKSKNPFPIQCVANSDTGPSAKENQCARKSKYEAREIPNDDLLLAERDVARRQGRSVRTLQNQRVSGGGIPYLKLGRSVRYRLSDVLIWEAARRHTSTSDGGDNA